MALFKRLANAAERVANQKKILKMLLSTSAAASVLLVVLFALMTHYTGELRHPELVPEALVVEMLSWLGGILSVGLLGCCAAAWDLTRRLSRAES